MIASIFRICQLDLRIFINYMNGDFPDDFEVYLIVDRRDQLSVGCWNAGQN